MEFVPALAMLALVKKLIDLLKYITNKDRNGIVTTVAAWIAGVVAVILYASTDYANGIQIGDMPLSSLNIASLIAIGLSIGAGAGVVNDFISAKRPTDDPAKLKLLPGAPPPRAKRKA